MARYFAAFDGFYAPGSVDVRISFYKHSLGYYCVLNIANSFMAFKCFFKESVDMIFLA